DLTLKLPTLVNRVAGGGDDAGTIECPSAFKVDDGGIGVMTDGDNAFCMPEPHLKRGIARQHVGNALEGDTAPEMALAQHHGKQRFEPRAARGRIPDTTGLAGKIAVHVVGGDRVDRAVGDASPQRFAIGSLAQRRIYLANIASREADIMRQIMRTRL